MQFDDGFKVFLCSKWVFFFKKSLIPAEIREARRVRPMCTAESAPWLYTDIIMARIYMYNVLNVRHKMFHITIPMRSVDLRPSNIG